MSPWPECLTPFRQPRVRFFTPALVVRPRGQTTKNDRLPHVRLVAVPELVAAEPLAAFALPPVNTQGSLGRNTLSGPGLVMIDASVVKTFKLSETKALQFRGEVFNLPNHPNFSIPSGLTSFTNAAGAVSPTFGKITSTTTTSRQIQLGLKFTF